MGRQITIYLLPSDTFLLEKCLKNTLDISFIEYDSSSESPKLTNSLEVPFMGESWLTIYLTSPSQVKNVRYKNITSQGYWTVDSLYSPVVEFSRCYFDGEVLRTGRLFYDSGYYDDSGKWVEKDRDFLEWADKLFRVVRKMLKKVPGQRRYAGTDAQAWLIENPQNDL